MTIFILALISSFVKGCLLSRFGDNARFTPSTFSFKALLLRLDGSCLVVVAAAAAARRVEVPTAGAADEVSVSSSSSSRAKLEIERPKLENPQPAMALVVYVCSKVRQIRYLK